MVQGQEELIVGLDIGTTKICAVVGEVSGDDINIIGIGSHPSHGLRKGVVVNIESTVESIQKAVEEAELMAGCEIRSVYAGIAGGHINGFNSRGIIAIKGGAEISQLDVDRVVDAARAVAIPMDREVIHVLPQEFIVDDQPGILNPIGMSAVRLEAKIHIVTGAVTSAHNIIKCTNKAGLDVADIVLEPLASSEAVLGEDEKELGTALIDLGGGTTDLAIFAGKNIKHTFVLSLGGNNLTSDIAIGLRAPLSEAEKIKRKYGTCLSRNIQGDEFIEVPGMGGRKPRKLSRQILGEILEPRMEEIFSLVRKEVYRAGMAHMINSGVVVTGGSSLLDGVPEVAESIFNLPTRLGRPRHIGGLVDVVNNPMYATGVGLVIYGARDRNRLGKRFRGREGGKFGRVFARMKRWFKEIV
ncbi:MAG: cell division protein FtsA [Desulfococcaceae bacterium]